MPIVPVDYSPLPFVGRPRQTKDTRTLGALLLRQGQEEADAARVKGQGAAAMWQQLGQLFAQYSAGVQAKEQQAAALGLRQSERAADEKLQRDEMEMRRQEREAVAAERRDALTRQAKIDAERRGSAVAEEIGYGPIDESQVDDVMQSPAAGRARYAFGPGTADGPELTPNAAQTRGIEAEKAIAGMGGAIGPNGQVVMPPRPPTPVSRAPIPAMVNGRRAFVWPQADGGFKDMRGQAVNAEPIPPAAETKADEPLIAVMGPDGSPVLVKRSEAAGRRPASTREQGRPVTSGDAGRLADIDEALKLANGLNFTPSDTGIMPSVGGAMPDAVTNLTGFGLEAKKRQGVINLVKQIIGKGLEGGVLRKEDESKYAKILPTLSDPPEVVQAKIANMQSTMAAKRSTLLDSLTDAGYDTSKFSERGAPTSKVEAVPDLTGLPSGRGRRFSDGPFKGQTWSIGPDGKPFQVK